MRDQQPTLEVLVANEKTMILQKLYYYVVDYRESLVLAA